MAETGADSYLQTTPFFFFNCGQQLAGRSTHNLFEVEIRQAFGASGTRLFQDHMFRYSELMLQFARTAIAPISFLASDITLDPTLKRLT